MQCPTAVLTTCLVQAKMFVFFVFFSAPATFQTLHWFLSLTGSLCLTVIIHLGVIGTKKPQELHGRQLDHQTNLSSPENIAGCDSGRRETEFYKLTSIHFRSITTSKVADLFKFTIVNLYPIPVHQSEAGFYISSTFFMPRHDRHFLLKFSVAPIWPHTCLDTHSPSSTWKASSVALLIQLPQELRRHTYSE